MTKTQQKLFIYLPTSISQLLLLLSCNYFSLQICNTRDGRMSNVCTEDVLYFHIDITSYFLTLQYSSIYAWGFLRVFFNINFIQNYKQSLLMPVAEGVKDVEIIATSKDNLMGRFFCEFQYFLSDATVKLSFKFICISESWCPATYCIN